MSAIPPLLSTSSLAANEPKIPQISALTASRRPHAAMAWSGAAFSWSASDCVLDADDLPREPIEEFDAPGDNVLFLFFCQ
jgi:hypothetical protein